MESFLSADCSQAVAPRPGGGIHRGAACVLTPRKQPRATQTGKQVVAAKPNDLLYRSMNLRAIILIAGPPCCPHQTTDMWCLKAAARPCSLQAKIARGFILQLQKRFSRLQDRFWPRRDNR